MMTTCALSANDRLKKRLRELMFDVPEFNDLRSLTNTLESVLCEAEQVPSGGAQFKEEARQMEGLQRRLALVKTRNADLRSLIFQAEGAAEVQTAVRVLSHLGELARVSIPPS